MKKFLAALLIVGSMFFASTVNAEIETYTDEGKATMSEAEPLEKTIERAKTYALRNASEKAGVYIKSRSELRDFELVEDEIITIASGVLKVIDTDVKRVWNNDALQVLVMVTVTIDTDSLQREIDKFLEQKSRQEPAKTYMPSDAFKYNGHSYKIFDTGLTWTDAKAYCESVGGHLVTITSSLEQVFVQDLITNRGTKGYYWTGGVRNSAGDFAWITGEKFSYSNWGNGEPSNAGGIENVIVLYKYRGDNGFWNDLSERGNVGGPHTFYNIENSGFVCEWDS